MKYKVLIMWITNFTLSALSMVGNAKVVDDMPFFIGSNELCYYPAGFISDSEARIYQILDNDNGMYGKFDGKFAKFFGPDEFSANPKPFSHNFALPSYIFSSGNYLPVLAVGTAFKNSPISIINMPDCIVSIEESAFYNASNLEYIFLPISLKYIGAEALVYLGEGKSIYFRSALPPAMEIKLASKFSEIWDIENSDEKELKDSYITPFGTKKDMIEYKIMVPKGSVGFYRLNRVFFDIPIEEYEIPMQAPINPVAPEGLRFGKAGNNALEVLGDLNKNNILEIPVEFHLMIMSLVSQ